jgi:Tol biopolymer transport system component
MAQRFDPIGLRTAGGVIPIADQVGIAGNFGHGAFAVSRTGTIAYRVGRGPLRQMAWMDRAGTRLSVVGKPDAISAIALSPDGKTVAFTTGNATAGAASLWLYNLDTGVQSKVALGGASGEGPVWSPDSQHIAFAASVQSVNDQLQLLPSIGAGQPEVLAKGPYNSIRATDWSQDGKLIAFNGRSEKTRDDIWLLTTADGQSVPFAQSAANEDNASFSPDSSWIAYQSDESGSPEIYVQHVPSNGSKFQVSSGGGMFPIWSRDGRELTYRDRGGSSVVVPVKSGVTFERGQARVLWPSVQLDGLARSVDGQRFLALVPAEGAAQAAPITVVTNWRPPTPH